MGHAGTTAKDSPCCPRRFRAFSFHSGLCERCPGKAGIRTRDFAPLALPMRRSITVLFLLAIVGGIAWWLWRWTAVALPPPDPWGAIPADAVAVLEVPNPVAAWKRATETSQFWGELEHTPILAGVNLAVSRLAEGDPAVDTKGSGGQPMLICWRPAKGDSMALLVAWPMQATPKALLALGSALGNTLPPTLWSGAMLSVQPDSLLPPLQLAWHRGLLLIGNQREVVQAALGRNAADARPDPLFQKARASFSAGADAHLLLKPAYAAKLLAPAAGGLFPKVAQGEGWAAMDVRLRPGAVLMNGLFFPADTTVVQALATQRAPARSAVLQVVPATVCRLASMQVTDPAAYVRQAIGKEPEEERFAAYAAWVEGTIGVAEAPPQAEGATQRWAVLQAADPATAMAALATRCPDPGCTPMEYRGIPVRRSPDQAPLAALFGPAFAAFDQPYWAVLSDLVVMTATPDAMRAAIDAWTDRNSLALDPRTGDFFQQFGSEAVLSCWMDLAKALPPTSGPWASVRKATGGALLQLTPRADGAILTTFCLQHAPTGQRAAGALWSTAMAAPLEGPPILVKDYLSKTLQVLVQDRDHRLSLISCTGKVLWQKQIDGPLIGGVHLVDRFRNGKFQMLCNTAGKIYLIDRLGRDVEGWPFLLKKPACTAAAVYDYEGNKEYRVLLPTADGALLNLGPDGKPVQGWTPKPLPLCAVAPVEHVRLRNKDFLVVPLRNGQVVVMDRRGTIRYDPVLQMGHLADFLGSREAMDIGDRRMLWTDSAGAVLSGTLDGRVDTLAQATSGKAAIFDLDGDGHDEVLRTTISALAVEAAGKAVFRVSFPDDPAAEAFQVPLAGGRTAIGLVLPTLDQLRMYGPNGDPWPGFPMKGAVRFQVADINLDGIPDVVSADREGVVTAQTLLPPH